MPDTFTLVSNVGPYSGSLQLDAYKPIKKRVPIGIFIHGGGWANGAKGSGSTTNAAKIFANYGILALDIDYTLVGAGGYTPQTPIDNVRACVQWARSNGATYNGDPRRVFILGGSSGGHLGLMAGIQGTAGDDRPDAVIAWSPPSDLEQFTDSTALTTIQNYVGVPLAGNLATWRLYSPRRQMSSNCPPIRIIGSTNEPLTTGINPYTQFNDTHTDALAAGVRSTLHVFDDNVHADFTGIQTSTQRPSSAPCDAEASKAWLEKDLRWPITSVALRARAIRQVA